MNTLIVGKTAGGTPVPVRVDADGKLVFDANFSGDITLGAVAIDQTTPGTTNAVQVLASALPANAATETTAAAILAKQPALGTAGTASADVITVQGIAGGTAMAVTGTVTPTLTTGSRVNSTEYEVSHVISADATKLISLFGYNSGPAQFIQLFDSATVPDDGAVPVFVTGVPAQASFGLVFGAAGLPFSNGCAVSNSTTGPTKTQGSANCFFTGVSELIGMSESTVANAVILRAPDGTQWEVKMTEDGTLVQTKL